MELRAPTRDVLATSSGGGGVRSTRRVIPPGDGWAPSRRLQCPYPDVRPSMSPAKLRICPLSVGASRIGPDLVLYTPRSVCPPLSCRTGLPPYTHTNHASSTASSRTPRSPLRRRELSAVSISTICVTQSGGKYLHLIRAPIIRRSVRAAAREARSTSIAPCCMHRFRTEYTSATACSTFSLAALPATFMRRAATLAYNVSGRPMCHS